MTEDRALVASFLSAVDEAVVASIEQRGTRLRGYRKLINQYADQCQAWRDGRVSRTRNLTERINELWIAQAIVEDTTVLEAEYEAPLAGTEQTIDFLVRPKSNPGLRLFYDVKTVHPEPRDAWDRYERARAEDRWTPSTELTLERDWMGGEIAHEKFASREKFIEHTLDLETKISATTDRDGACFRMIFCGNGSQWHVDELEDFAENYLTGYSRWDPFATMQAYALAERRREFQRAVAGFCCLLRQVRSLEVEYRRDVRVPRYLR